MLTKDQEPLLRVVRDLCLLLVDHDVVVAGFIIPPVSRIDIYIYSKDGREEKKSGKRE